MNINLIYEYCEKLLLYSLFFRFIYSLKIEKNNNLKFNLELPFFVFIALLNVITYDLFENQFLCSKIIHCFTPTMFTFFLLCEKFNLLYLKLSLWLISSIINWHFYNFLIIYIFYLSTVILLIAKSIKYTKLASYKIKVSALFLILAFDQIFTSITFTTSSMGLNWHQTNLMNTFLYTSYFIFILTYVMIHVNLRRLYSH